VKSLELRDLKEGQVVQAKFLNYYAKFYMGYIELNTDGFGTVEMIDFEDDYFLDREILPGIFGREVEDYETPENSSEEEDNALEMVSPPEVREEAKEVDEQAKEDQKQMLASNGNFEELQSIAEETYCTIEVVVDYYISQGADGEEKTARKL
jgi:hypothetical protein